jgi:archaellum component FlaC
MNYMNYLTKKGIIEEARQRGFGYTLDAKTDKLEVLAKSEGASKKIDDLVKEYKGIADLYKEVEEEKKTLQAKVKAKIKEVIDEDDQIKAIVLRSAKTSYELAKSSIGKDKTDYEKIFVAMQALLSGDLLEKLNDLKKIYTEAGKMIEFESKREGKVTVEEGIVETFLRKIKSLAGKISKFVSRFSDKLDAIEDKLLMIKSKKDK